MHLERAADTFLWQPKSEAQTEYDRFRDYVNLKRQRCLVTYRDVYYWSIDKIDEFWEDVWYFTKIRYSSLFSKVIDVTKPMDAFPEWFPDARLNFARNLLRFDDDMPAVIALTEGEDPLSSVRTITYAQLNDLVAHCATVLRKSGVTVGDRIAGYMPNCPETVVLALATTSLGAIWTSSSPEFGSSAVLERFAQVGPKFLFSVNAVFYNGKVHQHMGKLQEVAEGLPTLDGVVVLHFWKESTLTLPSSSVRWLTYHQFLSQHPAEPLEFANLPFNHPAYILYSSGTTGHPKCIVHSAGGTLLQHLKEHILHGNLSRTDRFLQYTTTGWMMWNWMVSVLALGATIVLYDGSPMMPHTLAIWDYIAKLRVTVFGTSAKYLLTLSDLGSDPKSVYDLSALHSIYSTGSPLPGDGYDYVYKHIKSDVLLGSITGGTDIISLFMGHHVRLPVVRGEVQCICLGMAVECWDADGRPVDPGHPGDLVCVKPFPSMPVSFWNDPGNEKYRAAYFAEHPHVWHHGDYMQINPHTGGIVMLGRSDGVLKPNGVRFGSAELYIIVALFNEVEDALAVGQRTHQGADERVILFLKMKPGYTFSTELADRVRMAIRNGLSPRHVPAVVMPIKDIPYTINGKKVEVPVKRILSGEIVKPSGAIANPKALEQFYLIATEVKPTV